VLGFQNAWIRHRRSNCDRPSRPCRASREARRDCEAARLENPRLQVRRWVIWLLLAEYGLFFWAVWYFWPLDFS
jgi:hypothetical protein